MEKIDLHMHSVGSDGKLDVCELIDWAIKKGLPAIAITDHDSINCLEKGIKYSLGKNIEFVSGVEFSCYSNDIPLKIGELHVVGLFIDFENEEIIRLCDMLRLARVKQKKKILNRLKGLGYDVSYDELVNETNGAIFGRPHIARILMRKYPEFERVSEVFDKLLRRGQAAYVDQKRLEVGDAIKAIHNAGGVAILAHPGLLEGEVNNFIEDFVGKNGDGIEVNYNYPGRGGEEDLILKFEKIAKEKNLLVSGGTDFHSYSDGIDIGDYGISFDEFEKLKKAAQKYKNGN